ncbi:NDP-glycosyltransferase YjiC-like [Panonychus citri]|uniref:NDP-glycosyltransferase YjiC-like n=1 Tax=Panonychus citri TaxID=50023 RepID=UPI002307C161|nr:NDP-glycosyltransferase YjiC-like [Panonychus citri]
MKIALIPMASSGRINICTALARTLATFNHECVFILPAVWTATLKDSGFQVETFEDTTVAPSDDVRSSSSNLISSQAAVFSLPALQQFPLVGAHGFKQCCDSIMKDNGSYAETIKRVKPDLIIFDFWTTVPAFVQSGIPYVALFSCSPPMIYWKSDAPPFSSGLGKGDDLELIKQTRERFSKSLEPIRKQFDEYLESVGINLELEDRLDFSLLGQSPHLNIYLYPRDLDYSEYGPVPEKWFRLEHMVRGSDDESPLGLPDDSWLNRTDQNDGKKLILFSLGSMATALIDIMNRLIGILAHSPHRFIVSKGIHHESIELPDNMIGGKYLNQMKIMPKVDLVIHHGGNSTFIETFYFGKPCIILPILGDQFDNGRRVVDLKVGASFSPHSVTQEQLLSAIDSILEDEQLLARVEKIGNNLRNTNSHKELNEKLESIVNNQK